MQSLHATGRSFESIQSAGAILEHAQNKINVKIKSEIKSTQVISLQTQKATVPICRRGISKSEHTICRADSIAEAEQTALLPTKFTAESFQRTNRSLSESPCPEQQDSEHQPMLANRYQFESIKTPSDLMKSVVLLKDKHQSTTETTTRQASLKKTLPPSVGMGVSGALNLVGMAGTSPTPAEEAMLCLSIIGTAILHTGGSYETFSTAQAQWPDFSEKNRCQKCKAVMHQVLLGILPFLGALPDGALTFLGIYYRTGWAPLAAPLAILNITAETITFTTLFKRLIDSVQDSKYQLFEGPVKEQTRQSLMRVFAALKSGDSSWIDEKYQREIETIHSLLKNNRKLRTDLAKMVIQSLNQGKSITQALQEYFNQPHYYEKLKGLGKAGLYITSSIVIFLYTAKFFAARGLVSSVETTNNLNATLFSNQTLLENSGTDFSNCTAFTTEASPIMTGMFNFIGYCGAVSSVFLGNSLSFSVEKMLKKGENLYIAFRESELVKEIQELFCEHLGIKLPSLIISTTLAFCYRGMAKSNTEYLAKLHEAELCDISGFGSYLPTMPGTEFVVVNAAYFTSLALYFLPLMMLLSLLPCSQKAPTDQHDPADGQAAIAIPEIAMTNQIELVPVTQPTY